jgi:NADH-quinone oxidoreductase subunit M
MILSVLTFLPLVGAMLLLAIPREKLKLIRGTAFAVSAITCLISIWLWSPVSSAAQTDFMFVEKHMWVARFGIHYFLGIDRLSIWMVLLTTVLSLAALVNAFGIEHRVKEFFIFFLILETAMLGVFLTLDLFLFYIFWEMTLIPLYFLIGIWGGPRKEYAAIKFFLFTFFGSVFMLVALIAMYFQSPSHTFDFTVLVTQAAHWPRSCQFWIFLGLLIAFAVKVPAFPLHTWLPLAHVEAPTPVSVILAGVLLKMGGYGLIRFAFPLAPAAAHDMSYVLGVIAVINIVYGSLCALAQKDIKRMIAYSSVAHMGYVLLGIAAMNVIGYCGAVMQMVAHGLITGALFLLVGVIYDRTHTRDMDQFGGIGERMPVYTGCMLMASFASLGLPLMAGFLGEFLCFLGAFQVASLRCLTSISLLGVLLTAAYFLIMLRRVFFSPARKQWDVLPDMNARELITVVPLLALALLLGLYPALLLNPLTQAFNGQF